MANALQKALAAVEARAVANPSSSKEPLSTRIRFIGNWAYFEGQKYWHQDIEHLADMRRKGIVGGTLEGDELEAFVILCLRSTDYQVLGIPMSEDEKALVRQTFDAPVAVG